MLTQVAASDDMFKDPCVGTIKYLEVEFKCRGLYVTHFQRGNNYNCYRVKFSHEAFYK